MLDTLEFTKKAVKGKKLSKDELMSLIVDSKRSGGDTRLEFYLQKHKQLEDII
jgi:hypothetical protein